MTKRKKNAKKKTNDLEKDLDKQGEEIQKRLQKNLIEAAAIGLQTAVSLAPVYTGRTRSLIQGRRTGQNSYRIVSINSTPERANFNLPVWLATSSRAPFHIKSGVARYMNRAALATQEALGEKGRVSMNRIFN